MLKQNLEKEQTPQQILQQKFGFQDFRPGQLEAIEALLQQGRLLCIQPTGHGKSLLYQLPSCLLSGITVVISPLLALMRDQVQQLNERFNIPAASINSDQSDEQNYAAQKQAQQGQLKILFIAPEKLDNLNYFNFLKNLSISLIVIDEAHCISTWGHDFRPSYRQIINFVHDMEQENQDLKVLALTATADKKTAEDIVAHLSKEKLISIQRNSMDRPNIALKVYVTPSLSYKLELVKQLLSELEGTGLIYCATRENTLLVADFLQHYGISAAAYHAGFSGAEKVTLQQQFLTNTFKVIAATNALGMGIDKQDLRFIIHFDVPGSITAYYQEVGRCGRDGQPATGILLFSEADKKIQQHFIHSAQPTTEDFEAVLSAIKAVDATTGLNLQAIKVKTGLHPTRVLVVVTELIEQGFIEKKLINRRQQYVLKSCNKKLDLTRYNMQFFIKQRELTAMLDYGKESKQCLMIILRKALGDHQAKACGHCSNCLKVNPTQVNSAILQKTNRWLDQRSAQIAAVATNNIARGVAVLDGQLRTKHFVEFMQNRSQDPNYCDEELFELIKQNLNALKQKYNFGSIIALPSRTWLARKVFAEKIKVILAKPLLLNNLVWKELPEVRQGELTNNDQRKQNVNFKMQLSPNTKIPKGDILLLDDYIGSGATMREAARVLRKQAMVKDNIVPFTIASIRWRLGRRGMV